MKSKVLITPMRCSPCCIRAFRTPDPCGICSCVCLSRILGRRTTAIFWCASIPEKTLRWAAPRSNAVQYHNPGTIKRCQTHADHRSSRRGPCQRAVGADCWVKVVRGPCRLQNCDSQKSALAWPLVDIVPKLADPHSRSALSYRQDRKPLRRRLG